jgi:monofunctional biosynthetic peptidoglycan transglycosylase
VVFTVDTVSVGYGPTLSIRSVSFYGVVMVLKGDLDEITREFREWRQSSPGGRSSSPAQSFKLVFDGVRVIWKIPEAPAEGSAPRQLVREPRAKRGPALLPDYDPDRGLRYRAMLGRLAEFVGRMLPHQGELELTGLRLKLERGAETFNIGPAELQVRRDREHLKLSLLPGAEGSHQLRIEFEAPLSQGPYRLTLDTSPTSLASMGVEEGDFGLIGVSRVEVEARGDLEISEDGSRLVFSGSGAISELSLRQSALSPEPVMGINVAWTARGELALDGSRVRIDQADLRLGKLSVLGKTNIQREGDFLRASLQASLPLSGCQEVLDSMPLGLISLVRDVRMSGSFGLSARLELDTRHLNKTTADFDLKNDCKITEVPESLSPHRFASGWTRQVDDGKGRMMGLESGPSSQDWVPYEAISPHVITAVLVCEDGHFFGHSGFDVRALQSSARENLLAGRFVRGGSTISMQLAKNLYLSHEKTLARKLEEAVLTSLLEQQLSKREILELYLNVVEFGPGLYGIGPAARRYFNLAPSDLSLGQALYLASILPNPKHRHLDREGRLTERWAAYLRQLMHVARKIHRIDDTELEAGLEEEVSVSAESPAPSPVVNPASETPDLGSGQDGEETAPEVDLGY